MWMFNEEEEVEEEVPELHEFRRVVESITRVRDRVLIEALYLTASRVSELAGKAAPYDLKVKATKPLGHYITWRIDKYEDVNVLVLKLPVAKRKPKKSKRKMKKVYKNIGLPLNEEYEPWSFDLLEYIYENKTLMFPLTRQRMWQIVKRWLREIDPEVHPHSLRHYRLSHLTEYYGFDDMDLTIYAGWTYKYGVKASGQLDTYLHLSWHRYFPKLLKKINF